MFIIIGLLVIAAIAGLISPPKLYGCPKCLSLMDPAATRCRSCTADTAPVRLKIVRGKYVIQGD